MSRSHAGPPSDPDVTAQSLSELERKFEVHEQQASFRRTKAVCCDI